MSSLPYLIRRSTPLDAGHLTLLAYRAKAHWGYSKAWLAVWNEALTVKADYLRAHDGFVAEAAGQTIGSCILERTTQGPMLEHVWVEPAWHRRGVGRALVQACLALARESHARSVRLHADPHAVGFYERLGAQRLGVVPAPMPGEPDRTLPVLEFVL